MCKTIFNNLNNDVKSQIKNICELYSNNTSIKPNKYNIKKCIRKFVVDLSKMSV